MPFPARNFADVMSGTAYEDGTRWFDENLITAQLLADAGDTAAALAAVRRRPWYPMTLRWLQTLPDHLRLEGRLAAAMADTLYAVRAHEHYLGLRPERPSHAPWAAEWDSVRAEVAALTREER
jgi:hypothetical protein